MLKRILAGTLAAACLAAPALADVYTGTTVARESLVISAPGSGMVQNLQVEAGMAVSEGDEIAGLKSTRVFATQDGTIARIHVEEGDEAEGTILELKPVSRYTIHCTADEAYDSAAGNLLHSGENLYIYCTYNGTHRGTGRVYSIDGATYMVEATGGELYIGETVYLYRDAEFSYKQRVGIGTVVGTSTELYANNGKVVKLHISEGEYVQRGELLYEIIEGDEDTISAPAGGIITGCAVNEGDRVEAGQEVAALAPSESICVAIEVEETDAAAIAVGDAAAITYAFDSNETLLPGVVSEISRLAQDGTYTVYIAPQTPPEYLGMTVNVRID